MEVVIVAVLAVQLVGILTIYGIVTRTEAKANQTHDTLERMERKIDGLIPKVHPSKTV